MRGHASDFHDDGYVYCLIQRSKRVCKRCDRLLHSRMRRHHTVFHLPSIVAAVLLQDVEQKREEISWEHCWYLWRPTAACEECHVFDCEGRLRSLPCTWPSLGFRFLSTHGCLHGNGRRFIALPNWRTDDLMQPFSRSVSLSLGASHFMLTCTYFLCSTKI